MVSGWLRRGKEGGSRFFGRGRYKLTRLGSKARLAEGGQGAGLDGP